MIADSMVSLVKNSSVIRAMFEEGNRLAKLYGAENVYDFSLGNPNVPGDKTPVLLSMYLLHASFNVISSGGAYRAVNTSLSFFAAHSEIGRAHV